MIGMAVPGYKAGDAACGRVLSDAEILSAAACKCPSSGCEREDEAARAGARGDRPVYGAKDAG